MSYKVSDLKNPNDVRESWLETPILNFLGDKLKRKENRHLIKVAQGATAIGKSSKRKILSCIWHHKLKIFQRMNLRFLLLNISTCLQEIQTLPFVT